jgi:AcrR family transcriptional regulator
MPAVRSRGRQERSVRTREAIVRAVRALVAEGAFYEAPVEAVAERAGISRATLYQHFRSRLDLVDAMCDGFAANPELQAIREAVTLPDPAEALDATLARTVAFYGSEDALLRSLYDAAAVEPAAREFVERQTADRRGTVAPLARRLGGGRETHATLMLLTSFGAYRELRDSGLSDRRASAWLQDAGHRLLG